MRARHLYGHDGRRDLDRALNHGSLPRIYESSRPGRLLEACVSDYLKEKIAAEGLVRNLPTFSGFPDIAALSDGEMINFSNVAREYRARISRAKVASDHLHGLRNVVRDFPGIERRIVVRLEHKARRTDDGIEIWPATMFVRRLWNDDIV